ncbi:MAG TPA: glycosyltransferase [Propionibacteriaceae bacterium]|nr:glycosyltransferase [Propionibacteriaceae bacterium]
MTRPRILVTLTDRTEPADNGKRLRAAANLRALARVGDLDVVLLHFDQPLDVRPVPPDVPTDHWSVVRKQRHSLPEAAFRMLRLLPLQIAAVDWMPLRAEIIKLTQRHWDLVWFGSLDHFAVLRDLIGDVPVVVDYDDVEPAKTDAFLEVAPRDPAGRGMRVKARVERVFWRRLERLAQERAAAVVVCSDLDVRRLGGRRAVAVPNTYPDPGAAVPLEAPADPEFLLIANFGYKPNIDAARFVTQDVLPVIRRALPNAVVHLAGHEAGRYLTDLSCIAGVKITGTFPAVRPLLDEATAVIVPVRYGGGTRLKIIEAWAHSMPVVSTSLGAEGLGARNGGDILLADGADEFAAACIRIACESELRARLAAAGRQHYEADYQPVAAEQTIIDLLTTVLLG